MCNNVEAEPKLIPLDNEQFRLQSTNRSPDARLDIKAGEFWARGVTSFFDVRVSHVNSQCHQNKATSDIFKEQEAEKKRKYQQRILEWRWEHLRLWSLERMEEWETNARNS